MPLLILLRTIFGALSLLILAAAGYLLWSWWDGEFVRDVNGALVRAREDWRLWTALGLLAWSFLGRLVLLPLLAKPDRGTPSRAIRGAGQTIVGAGGGKLYIESHGPASGPAIVLTHGWGLDGSIWNLVLERLAKRRRVIVWDLPGLGRSSAPADGAISLTSFAADLRSVQATAGAPVVLVGHSIGGMTIQTLARDEGLGDDVAGVVLVNTTYVEPLKTMILSGLVQALRWPVLEPMMRLSIWFGPLAQLSAWQSYLSGAAHLANRFGFGPHVTRSQLEHTTLLATRNSQAAQAKGNLAMFRWAAGPGDARLDKPTLVLAGDKDIVTKAEASRTIVERAPKARLKVIHDANHMGFLELADAYASEIEAFADETLGAPRQHAA